jgi:hypothetical protein
MKFKRPDGRTVRPSLVVLDDPQTDESARSLSQCANRESILAGAVLGLAGPGYKISAIIPCTVIRPSDMADNILDRNRHPKWNGEHTKMVYAFPKIELLWERYAEFHAEGMRGGDGGEAATEFYRQNQAAMDEGAVIAWQERFNYDELSAIQHAMNLKLQDEAAFFAEYQNQPLPAETVVDGMLKPEEVASKINRMDRGLVSIGANHLTAFIHVQQKLLFYVVAAREDDFTGYVLDYGCYPDQQRPYFTLREARQTLSSEATCTGLEGWIYAGLESLTSKLLDREWQRDDGAAMRIGRCLIDANWGQSTDVVYDTNWWKSFVNARLRVSMGDRGCLSLFGSNAETHRMHAEHLTSEYFVKTEARGRSVDEWKQRPEQPDNHWFDCLVGSAVAASLQAVVFFGTDRDVPEKRNRLSFKEMQGRRRG